MQYMAEVSQILLPTFDVQMLEPVVQTTRHMDMACWQSYHFWLITEILAQKTRPAC